MSTKKLTRKDNPIDTVHHDVLLIAADDRFYRFPVEKNAGPDQHLYTDEPVVPALIDPGTRKIRNLAQQGDGGELGPRRGPVFATLPLNPEPASSSSLTCYLINTRNLEYQNPWTAQEWSQAPSARPKLVVPDCEFRMLVAAPDGKVYLLEKQAGSGTPSVRLADQSNLEVWSQLRNGTVVGRVLYEDQKAPREIVPLVNMTSLIPNGAGEGVPRT